VRSVATIAMALSMLAGAGAVAAEARAPAKVPASFIGVVGDGPLTEDPAVDFGGQLTEMVANGVQTMRIAFNWAEAQPYRSFSDVPQDQLSRFQDEGGVPTDWSRIDLFVTLAAERRITLVPVVLLVPSWDARHPGESAPGHPGLLSSPPIDPQPYAEFTRALVRRYGPGGTFWRQHSELVAQPIRYWQIWNEPNLKPFWSDQPFEQDYVALLRLSREAIRSVDPTAKIVLAGLPNASWNALARIYSAGGRGLFDVAAFHPFTAQVGGVKTIIDRDRRVMAKNGDARKPLWITELSWTSAKGKTSRTFGNEETERGQAQKLTAAFTLLARLRTKLKVQRVYWYTWLSQETQTDYPFDWAGLERLTSSGIEPKPALAAFRRVALRLEGCRTKGDRADRCAS
jgi:hypothetical protein